VARLEDVPGDLSSTPQYVSYAIDADMARVRSTIDLDAETMHQVALTVR